MVLLERQNYIKQEEDEGQDFGSDRLEIEYTSRVTRHKMLSAASDGEHHICDVLPIRKLSTDTQSSWEDTHAMYISDTDESEHDVYLLEIGSMFDEPAVVEDEAACVPFHNSAGRTPFSKGHDRPGVYYTPYREAVKGGKSKAKVGSRITKTSSSYGLKQKRKEVLVSVAGSVPALQSELGTANNVEEFPDFFYAYNSMKYAIYAYNCSRHQRHWDFFRRNLDYHFRAGHFHEEFLTEEDAIAAYWRAQSAKPDTADTERSDYKELHYMTKLKALWGSYEMQTPKCPNHGVHRLYSKGARTLPYELPDPKTDPRQSDAARSQHSANPIVTTVDDTNRISAPTAGSIEMTSKDSRKKNISVESFNALKAEMQTMQETHETLTDRLTSCETILAAHETRSRFSIFAPGMSVTAFPVSALSPSLHWQQGNTDSQSLMATTSSNNVTLVTTPAFTSTDATSMFGLDFDELTDLDDPSFDLK